MHVAMCVLLIVLIVECSCACFDQLNSHRNNAIVTGQIMEPVITTILEASTRTMRTSLWQ